MKISGYILKPVALLLLKVTVYMHVCSFVCASGAGSCCSKMKGEKTSFKKECCKHKKSSENKKGGCQDIHLSFFNTSGQFAQDNTFDVIKSFAPSVALVFQSLNIFSVLQDKAAFAENGFHPPPPKPDIRIFIQSFII